MKRETGNLSYRINLTGRQELPPSADADEPTNRAPNTGALEEIHGEADSNPLKLEFKKRKKGGFLPLDKS